MFGKLQAITYGEKSVVEKALEGPVYEVVTPWPPGGDKPYAHLAVMGFKPENVRSRYDQVEDYLSSGGDLLMRRLSRREISRKLGVEALEGAMSLHDELIIVPIIDEEAARDPITKQVYYLNPHLNLLSLHNDSPLLQ